MSGMYGNVTLAGASAVLLASAAIKLKAKRIKRKKIIQLKH